MSYLKEKAAYLKGLAEGMQLSETTNEGKLLKAILDVMDDFALIVDDLEETQEQLIEQVDNMDEDLAEVERVLFDDDDDDTDEDDDDTDEDDDDEDEDDEEDFMYFKEIKCPHCKLEFELEPDMIDDDDNIECPGCKESLNFEDICGCDECGHHGDEHK